MNYRGRLKIGATLTDIAECTLCKRDSIFVYITLDRDPTSLALCTYPKIGPCGHNTSKYYSYPHLDVR